jgi:DNA-binding NarL/FixJ family response regulator
MEKLSVATQNLKPERRHLTSDLIAGLTFAVVNVPQAMAHALLATVNPVYGIYTLMVAVPIGAIFTSSVFMNVSTTSALSVAAGAGLAYIPTSQRLEALAVLVLLVGVIQLLAALLHRLAPPGVAPEYLSKLLVAFREVVIPPQGAGQPGLIEPLSARELEVLALLGERLSNKEIAQALTISSQTVKKHANNIYQKLQAAGRREAVAKAIRLGLLQGYFTFLLLP